MNISKISNQNFGQFYQWKKKNAAQISDDDSNFLEFAQAVFNNRAAKRICAYGELKRADGTKNKYARVILCPHKGDLVVLQHYHPDKERSDYKFVSNWMNLDSLTFIQDLEKLMDKYYKCINMCKYNPNIGVEHFFIPYIKPIDSDFWSNNY